MPNDVVVDTGLFYALFDRDDRHHAASVELIRRSEYALFTTLAVVTETCYLLQRLVGPHHVDFLRWIKAGGVQIVPMVTEDWDRVIEVLEKYADLPADFADASLVAVAERLRIRKIAAFDSDFDVYRYMQRSQFRNVLR